jgi:hypothetical protein
MLSRVPQWKESKMVEPISGTSPPAVEPNAAATASAELSALMAKEGWSERFFAGHVEERRAFADLTAVIAAGDDVKAAMEGSTAEHPIVETVWDGGSPRRVLADAAETMRGSGCSDLVIEQALRGDPVTAQEREAVRRYEAMRHSDKEWVKRLLAGDADARREQLLMSVVMASEVK